MSVTWGGGTRNGIKAYTGREWDPETGLYYYRARYYDPKVGRFISEDPIGFEGDDPNLYAYVEDDPVNWIDPSGLIPKGGYGPGAPSNAARYAIVGGAIGAGVTAVGSIGVDVVTGGANILATPAEIAIGGAVGAAAGYGIGALVDFCAEHTKGKRKSTKEDHEAGDARRGRDRGGEKGDARRRPPRIRPDKWKGPWPPRE
jgi:RHS repeat-associated protein